MPLFSRHPQVHDLAAYAALTQWFQSPLGRHLLAREHALVDGMLGKRFGHHVLQLGCAGQWLYEASPMEHRFSLTPFPQAIGHQGVAEPEALPLATASVDCILLHHALDYAEDQHQLLREVSRVLIAGGHVIIVGFNPLSTWGLRSLLAPGRRPAPWHARMLRCLRVCDWLKLLDFHIDEVRHAVYSLPFDAPAIIRYSGWMEPLAAKLNWPTGGIYVIAARKQVLPLIPVNQRRRRRAMPTLGLPLAEGSTGRGSVRSAVHKEPNE